MSFSLSENLSWQYYRISLDMAQEMAENKVSQGKKSIKLYLESNPTICEHRLQC